jgi:hypothetical protein
VEGLFVCFSRIESSRIQQGRNLPGSNFNFYFTNFSEVALDRLALGAWPQPHERIGVKAIAFLLLVSGFEYATLHRA